MKLNCFVFLLSGGQAFGDIEECIILEELAYGCSGIMTCIVANNLGVSKRSEIYSMTTQILMFGNFESVQM